MWKRLCWVALGWMLFGAGPALGAMVVLMDVVDSQGMVRPAGTVMAEQTPFGLVLTPQLRGLAPGPHGFHVHQNPSCAPLEKNGRMVAALAAGGHYDPAGAGHHGSPWGDGHLGDLPALSVDAEGNADIPVLAPRLKLEDLQGRSLMVHAGSDNYADKPMKLGGGGARVACGVVPQGP